MSNQPATKRCIPQNLDPRHATLYTKHYQTLMMWKAYGPKATRDSGMREATNTSTLRDGGTREAKLDKNKTTLCTHKRTHTRVRASQRAKSQNAADVLSKDRGPKRPRRRNGPHTIGAKPNSHHLTMLLHPARPSNHGGPTAHKDLEHQRTAHKDLEHQRKRSRRISSLGLTTHRGSTHHQARHPSHLSLGVSFWRRRLCPAKTCREEVQTK